MKRYLYVLLSISVLALFSGCSKDVANKEIKLKVNDTSYTAIYTGTLKNGAPSGAGTIKIFRLCYRF